MKGTIFDIQRFCLDDGPGIRTTVFLKGCMLRCAWCHNPESLSAKVQLAYYDNKCVKCGTCRAVCPHGVHSFTESGEHQVDHSACVACGQCVKACPADALALLGRTAEAADVIEQVMKDEAYYRHSGGGVTFSGGEPTMQYEFLKELLQLAKERGLHTCMETNGTLDPARMKALLPYLDLVLLDYKMTDEAMHKQYIGIGRAPVLRTFALLAEENQPVVLRAPIIPGLNDNEEHFAAIRALKAKYPNIQRAQVMPYHTIGKGKYGEIGLPYSLASLKDATEEQRAAWQARVDAAE